MKNAKEIIEKSKKVDQEFTHITFRISPHLKQELDEVVDAEKKKRVKISINSILVALIQDFTSSYKKTNK